MSCLGTRIATEPFTKVFLGFLIISDSVSKLSAITDQTPIDWDAFDSVLKGLEDINAYDEYDEETILSEFIMDGEFYKRGFILADVVRHFLACGYDVSANDGLNGGLALHSLCWSSYDHYVLEAAKVLMNAGAPVKYRTSGDDPNEEPECLLGSISWKISGAWMVDKDYAWANILEAYYAMTEANIAGKDYNAMSSNSVSRVSAPQAIVPLPALSRNIMRMLLPSSVMMQHTFSISVLEQPTDTSLVFALVPRNCLLNTHVSIHYSNRPKPHGFMIKIICPQYALISQRDTCIWRLQNIMTSKSSFRIKFIILWITMFCLAKRANTWNS